MNYAQYLEDGNKVANQSVEKQVESLVKSARQELEAGLPGEACNAIKQAWQDEEQKQILTQVADSNPQLGELLSGIISTLMPGSLKCGGKVRAKIKKACGGKKLETGDKIKKAEAGCNCKKLMKIGGRLVEVDCNMVPIVKDGAIAKFLPGGKTDKLKSYTASAAWHNKRYTPEEITKMQAALNKAGLGKQIETTGKFDEDTYNAIVEFLRQHENSLVKDGLLGDQTASALGITGLGNSSLPQTRAGQNQARRPGIDTSTAQGRADKQASDYYNSPEMLRYLMNASNAAIGSPEYINHYYNALKYVSPEIASKLRTLNNEGDEYDEMASKNRGQAFNRQVGIKEFKNAMASGILKTADDLDRWMTSHNLSKEEMNELMADPSVGDAMLIAGVRADNGRINSQTSQAKRFAKDVASAESKAGVGVFNSLTPISEAVYGTIKDVQDKGAGELRPDRWLYNRLNNTILSGYTGSHPTYLTDVTGSTGNQKVDYLIDIAAAPESWMRFGASRNLNTNRVKPKYWKTTVKAGDIKTPAKSYTNGYIELGVTPRQPELSFYNVEKPEVRYKVGHNAGDLRTPGKLKFNYVNEFNGYQIPAIHGVLINNSLSVPVIQEVPSYDKGVTYGPYIGINRVKFKQGGKVDMEKQKFIKKANTGCKCKKLMRVGGKLVEVDCNNVPIAKNGTVMKFLNPPQPLQMTGNNSYTSDQLKASGAVMDDKGKNTWLYLNPEDNTYYRHSTPGLSNSAYGNWTKASDDEINRYHQLKGHIKTASGNWMMEGENGLYTNSGYANTRYGRTGNSFLPDFGKKDATWNKDKGIWELDGFTYDKTGWKPNAKEEPVAEENREEAPQTTWRDTFGAGKVGKFGGLTYDEAIARQKEMAAAQGFGANFGKQDGMWGQKSKAEWERYQTWKQQQADLAQRKADREAVGPLLSRPAVQAQGVLQDVVHPTDDRLREMDVKRAMGLPFNQDYRRWLELKFPGVKLPPLSQGNTDWLTMYKLTAGQPMFKNGGSLNYAQYLNLK